MFKNSNNTFIIRSDGQKEEERGVKFHIKAHWPENRGERFIKEMDECPKDHEGVTEHISIGLFLVQKMKQLREML